MDVDAPTRYRITDTRTGTVTMTDDIWEALRYSADCAGCEVIDTWTGVLFVDGLDYPLFSRVILDPEDHPHGHPYTIKS